MQFCAFLLKNEISTANYRLFASLIILDDTAVNTNKTLAIDTLSKEKNANHPKMKEKLH